MKVTDEKSRSPDPGPDLNLDTLVSDTDPRILIRTKMSRIHYTGDEKGEGFRIVSIPSKETQENHSEKIIKKN